MQYHAFAFMLVLICTPVAADMPAIPDFMNETATAGVDHHYDGDWEYIVGGGAATFDCNHDHKPEILLAGGTAKTSLWINASSPGGSLSFTHKPNSGLEMDAVLGVFPVDIDSDQHLDVMLLRVGENTLMRGLGDCRFEPVNAAWNFEGGDDWSTAFAATWEQGAKWPTLAIGNYIDRTKDTFPWGSCTDNWLYRPADNHQSFAAPLALKPSFCALSMLFSDWNRSGSAALRISNDREYYKGGQEQLWNLSKDQAPRLYTEAENWQRLQIWGMGIASYDLNFDGYPEYFLTSMADNKLQSLADLPEEDRQATPQYTDIAFALGAIAQRPYTGGEIKPSTAWHAQFEDVNNDGLVDLFIAKGNVAEMPDFAIKDPNNLLLQRLDGRFQEAGHLSGVASMHTARGAALADLNMDGWVDLVVVNRHSQAELWRNAGLINGANPTAHWVQISLRQPRENTYAIGAWIEVRTEERTQRREITVGGGHAGGSLGWHHFGLGEADQADVRVIWPNGSVSEWMRINADAFLKITPGEPLNIQPLSFGPLLNP